MFANRIVKHAIYLSIAATQIFSSSLFIPGLDKFGGTFFRFILLIVSSFIFIKYGFSQTRHNIILSITACFSLFVFMTASLPWSTDIISGIKQISYVLTIILLLYCLENIIKRETDFIIFCKYVLIIGIIVSMFSYYEIKTGIHFFPSQTFDEAAADPKTAYRAANMAWFTFSNPNNLAVHLSICSILVLLLLRKSLIHYFVALPYILFNVYLIDDLGARLAIVANFVFILTYIFLLSMTRLYFWSILVMMAPCVIILLLVGGSYLADALSFMDDSIVSRLRLLGLSVNMARDSFLAGIGTGGFPGYIAGNRLTNETFGIVDPHNAFARMLGENGIIGLALFAFVVFGPVFLVTQSRRPTRYGAFILATLVCLPMLLSIHSDPLSSSSLQLFIAMIWVADRFVEMRTG